jgi:thioredoxin reductase (NADPH)
LLSADIVVVGAGPAGCAAAVQCKRLGIDPLLINRTRAVGGLVTNACLIENYPGVAPLAGRDFIRLLGDHLARFDIAVDVREVTGLSRVDDGFALQSNSGPLRARAVILAAGTAPRTIDIPGAGALADSGLFYEVQALMSAVDLATAGRVFVVGSGEAALDYALTLVGQGVQVTVLVRGRALKATGRLVDSAQANPGIKLSFGVEPQAVRQTEQGLEIDIERDGSFFTAVGSAVLVAIGRRSTAPELLSGLDADLSGAVSTGIQGLFVAGDARSGRLGQVGTAVGDGLAAAMAAAEWVNRN